MDRVAVLVISHNYPSLTDSLCEKIIDKTKGVPYDLHVIETGSDLTMLSKYTTLWVKDGCRMTRGWNLLKSYADSTLRYKTGLEYSAYMLFVNDAEFLDDQDMISILYKEMMDRPDCGQIHPYQVGKPFPHVRLNKVTENETRKESFSEIVCPMIRASAWEACGPDLLDNRFFYGWGLDYDIPYQMHQEGYRIYITDKVGVKHIGYTSYTNRDITKETMDAMQFSNVARHNMHEGFINKYGKDWMQKIVDGVPKDVSKEALYYWLSLSDGFRGTV